MTRQDFREIDFKLTSIGKVFRFDDADYHFITCHCFGWVRPSSDKHNGREGYINHPNPKQNGWGILLAINKVIVDKFYDIGINVGTVGFYSFGPCGMCGLKFMVM